MEANKKISTAEHIKRLILRSGLKPGDAVPTELELCNEIGVSRTSVREAIKKLATLDIVEVRHGHGTVVGQMGLAPLVETLVFRGVTSPGDELSALREVVDLRQSLDLAMADRIVNGLQRESSEHLFSLVVEMENKAQSGQACLKEDRQFHASLMDPIGNQLSSQLVTAFWDIHAAVAPRLGVVPTADLIQTAKAHRVLLDAAITNDVDAYRTGILEHYAPLVRALDTATTK